MTATPDARAPESAAADRLLSLDFFRGLTMLLLIGESTRIYSLLVDPSLGGTLVAAVGAQLHHHPLSLIHI